MENEEKKDENRFFAGRLIELEIQGDKFVLKKISFHENNKLLKEVTRFNPRTRQSMVDLISFREKKLLKMLKQAPFPVTIENIQKLDEDYYMPLMNIVEDIASISPEEEKKSKKTS